MVLGLAIRFGERNKNAFGDAGLASNDAGVCIFVVTKSTGRRDCLLLSSFWSLIMEFTVSMLPRAHDLRRLWSWIGS